MKHQDVNSVPTRYGYIGFFVFILRADQEWETLERRRDLHSVNHRSTNALIAGGPGVTSIAILPAANAPVNFDQGPFITKGFTPTGQSVEYYNFDVDMDMIFLRYHYCRC